MGILVGLEVVQIRLKLQNPRRLLTDLEEEVPLLDTETSKWIVLRATDKTTILQRGRSVHIITKDLEDAMTVLQSLGMI